MNKSSYSDSVTPAWPRRQPNPELSGDSLAIRIRDLDYSFGTGESRHQVLFDINLDVRPGEILIMTGPSGSGKTTLLTLIGAIRSAQEGSLHVLGRNLSGLNREQLVEVRRDIGFVFQHHGLFESLTSLQNVRMALELHDLEPREIRKRAARILGTLGLEHRLDYRPGELSGGQKQRVAVARALVNNPRLVLADEPTAALDKESGREVVDLLQKLAREEGSAILIVTHDNRILDVADRILNMVDGRIVSDIVVEESIIICQFLSRCAVFSELTPTSLTEVAHRMSVEYFPAEAEIIRQGEPGEKFYLIREGIAEVTVDDGIATQALATLGEGEFFGEMALLTGEPRNATVTSKEPVQLYTLQKQDFQAVLDQSTSFRDQLLKVFFQRQR